MDQRQPFAIPRSIEARDIQRAMVEQVTVGCAITRIEPVTRDELVDVLELGVIPHVGGHSPISRQDGVGTLVAEAPESRSLARWCSRVRRVDFDDPAVAEWLARLAAQIKTRIDEIPAINRPFLDRPTSVRLARGLIGGGCSPRGCAAKIILDVLFCRQVGAPRGFTTRAVGERTERHGSRRVSGGAHQGVAARGTRDVHRRIGGDTTR